MGQHSTISNRDGDDSSLVDPRARRLDGTSVVSSEALTAVVARGGVLAEVHRIIELIRPAVQSDGGDLELVEVTSDGVVKVRFHGACVGCPSSTLTLQSGIERSLRDRVEGVIRVEAVA